MHVKRGEEEEEMLRNATYVCLKFVMAKIDSLNAVSNYAEV
jgi:hypothetical protein